MNLRYKFKYISRSFIILILMSPNSIVISLQGTIKLVFQPGEEGYAGAYHMLQHGVLDDLNGIFFIHVLPSYPTGVIASRPGTILAGAGLFSVTIRGKGGHAATPHHNRDPILAAAFTILALQQIVSRETDPLEARVISSSLYSQKRKSNSCINRNRFPNHLLSDVNLMGIARL